MIRSETIASASADRTIEGRYSAGKSGGHKTIRRATPSSSISAAAAMSWSVIAMTTELPLSSWQRPPSIDPESRSRRDRRISALERKGSQASTVLLTASQSEAELFCNMFIKVDEITERYWELSIFRFSKRVDAEGVFKPGYKDSEGKRIQPRVQQFQPVCQRSQPFVLLLGDLLELIYDFRSSIHGQFFFLLRSFVRGQTASYNL